MKPNIIKGDTVVILRGKERSKRGTVKTVLPAAGMAIVEGANVVKRHTKQQATKGSNMGSSQTGGIVEKEGSIHISNVAISDPKSDKPTRVGYKFLDDGRKVRFARGSGETIDR